MIRLEVQKLVKGYGNPKNHNISKNLFQDIKDFIGEYRLLKRGSSESNKTIKNYIQFISKENSEFSLSIEKHNAELNTEEVSHIKIVFENFVKENNLTNDECFLSINTKHVFIKFNRPILKQTDTLRKLQNYFSK